MVIRQRAIQAHDKQERHHAILDAAERLLLRAPERVANVSEVADEAGLAKGTVYLYFPSKEELLLALHERNIDGFFRPLLERHFPQLKPGDGVTLLRHSYALIIGLWQMYGAKGDALHCPISGLPVGESVNAFDIAYPDDLQRALTELWQGAIGGRDQGGAR